MAIILIASALFMFFLWGLTRVLESRAKARKITAEKRDDAEAAEAARRHYLED
jgi:hypothetical protein